MTIYHLTLKCILDLQPIYFFLGGGGGGVGGGWRVEGGGVDGWTEEQSQTNLPLQLLRSVGHNNGTNYIPDKLNL